MKHTIEWNGQPLEVDADDRLMSFTDSEGQKVMMFMPGYNDIVMIPVGGPGWYWNGDKRQPTFSPSILTRTNRGEKQIRNHVFVRNGVIEYLRDCSHELAGEKILLPRLEDWPEELKLWNDE